MRVPIRVAIRADAGVAVGTGHFARVSAVVGGLAAYSDIDIMLVTSSEGAALVPSYFPEGTNVLTLAADELEPAATMLSLDRLGWKPEIFIVDQYGWVPQWEEVAAKTDFRLSVFDDFDVAKRADLIVRPHGGPEMDSAGIPLRGPSYLPLSGYVARLAKITRPDHGSRLRLNICFGGSDPTSETLKTLHAVTALEGLMIDVVVGPGAQIDTDILNTIAQMPNVIVHVAPLQEDLAKLMANADLAIGAGGVMLWERLCLGVPSLVIAVADNQRPQIDKVAGAGAIRFLGDHANVTPQAITQAVTALAMDREARQKMAASGKMLVDGRGAARLAAWIRALALDIADVQISDAQDLFEWRTDILNWQHNFDDGQKPNFDSHVAWLRQRLADPACVFKIISHRDEPVGVVRFDLGEDDSSAYLSIYLVPKWHGRKMGLPVYFAAERALRTSHPGVEFVVSRIHCDNAASERLHRD
jgi:UDP-2,4-diacetamido-2,4,6-trideoxy-beta-L-altropyranose hydrolase